MTMNNSNLARVEEAHKRREIFLELHGQSRVMEVRMLWEIWHNKDWKNLGFDSFKAYFEAPRDSGGLDISRSWANELIITYQKYVKELGQPESIFLDIAPRKLYYLKNDVTQDNIEEILAKAKHTPLRDLMLEREGVDETNCAHDMEILKHCKVCGIWEKVEVAQQHKY